MSLPGTAFADTAAVADNSYSQAADRQVAAHTSELAAHTWAAAEGKD